VTVVSLADERKARTPHWQGKCVCLGCRHEWEAVGPIGTHTSLECPECGLPQGVTKYPYGAKIGDLVLRCDCGCEAITIYKRAVDMLKVARCMACGADLTESFFA
jgi:hypothetical protein